VASFGSYLREQVLPVGPDAETLLRLRFGLCLRRAEAEAAVEALAPGPQAAPLLDLLARLRELLVIPPGAGRGELEERSRGVREAGARLAAGLRALPQPASGLAGPDPPAAPAS
jgi:hypothetical protein